MRKMLSANITLVDYSSRAIAINFVTKSFFFKDPDLSTIVGIRDSSRGVDIDLLMNIFKTMN